jgi:hypothetical protein
MSCEPCFNKLPFPKSCPSCQNKKFEEIGRKDRLLLERINFACQDEDCRDKDKEFSYKVFIMHLRYHSKKKCPLKCGKDLNFAEFQDHAKVDLSKPFLELFALSSQN